LSKGNAAPWLFFSGDADAFNVVMARMRYPRQLSAAKASPRISFTRPTFERRSVQRADRTAEMQMRHERN
jgi:hypothetical protein